MTNNSKKIILMRRWTLSALFSFLALVLIGGLVSQKVPYEDTVDIQQYYEQK